MGNSSPYPKAKGSKRDALYKAKGSSSALKIFGTSSSSSKNNKNTPVVVVLPEGLPVVHAKLFFHSPTLQRRNIPPSVERIRFSAFESCQALVVVSRRTRTIDDY
ncbi:unnamed protein product [Cylindrotheca closterium]|uniref:Uncharacterized protein n=1 Tax=Cylindrotheca closterium TaxID=2856 RepID=A0AAD2G8Y1_9STRA|nr:unnamed protein product [Cylindrotheca closterium]CAJ1967942.1 unnamed protein product [Cylindrotheca closterium]